MERNEKIKNLKKMVTELDDYNLGSIYSLVWSLTTKDLLIKSKDDRLNIL